MSQYVEPFWGRILMHALGVLIYVQICQRSETESSQTKTDTRAALVTDLCNIYWLLGFICARCLIVGCLRTRPQSSSTLSSCLAVACAWLLWRRCLSRCMRLSRSM
jgi:hypothetical protein